MFEMMLWSRQLFTIVVYMQLVGHSASSMQLGEVSSALYKTYQYT
jgi:hypothetical protein